MTTDGCRVRTGVRIGVDVGSVRVGVAVCDPAGLLAAPVETVPRSEATRRGKDIARIATIVEERSAVEVVVGLPLAMSGGEGSAAEASRAFALRLARRLAPVPVRLVDERLSTVAALAGLRAGGRSDRKSRAVVDAEAAAIVLQTALDTERGTGTPAGEIVEA